MAFLFLVIAAAISIISCDELSDAASYLQHFGYYNPNAYDGSSNLENAIRTYQWFYQLNETGVLDQETKDMMSKPRCGFPDITHNYGYYSTRRRWRSNTVNYAYDNYGGCMSVGNIADVNGVRIQI